MASNESPVVSANVAMVGSEDAQNPINPRALAAPNPMLIWSRPGRAKAAELSCSESLP